MTEFKTQLEEVQNDTRIREYFTQNDSEWTLQTFLTTYIEVDKMMNRNKSELNKSEINEKLETLNTVCSSNFKTIEAQYQTLREKMANLQNGDHLNNALDRWQATNNISNLNELKTILGSIKTELQTTNESMICKVDSKLFELVNSLQVNLNNCIENSGVHGKVTNIEQTLTTLYNNFTHNSSKKGEYAENILSSRLPETFPEAEIVDTHNEPNSGDFHIVMDNRPKILIESKNFSGNVPKRDIDKFYKDIQMQNCCGILCNTFGGIANKKHFEIDIIDNTNILVFVHNYQFDTTQLQLAANVIYNTHRLIKEKTEESSVSVSSDFFSALKLEYDNFLRSFQHHLNIIKSSVNSLTDLHFTLVNDFFHRKSSKSNIITPPQFMCDVCNKGFASKWSLKRHVVDNHDDIPVELYTRKPREKKEKKQEPQVKTDETDTDNSSNDNSQINKRVVVTPVNTTPVSVQLSF
jgi:hypothetical protein